MRIAEKFKNNGLYPTSATCCEVVARPNLNGAFAESLSKAVDSLCDCSSLKHDTIHKKNRNAALPSRDVIISLMEDLRSVLFPGYFGVSEMSDESMRYYVGSTLDQTIRVLQEQIRRGLCFTCAGDTPERCADCEAKSIEIARELLKELPGIQRTLATDVRAAYEGDPAAISPEETVFCYPGVQAITNYRIANILYKLEVPVVPRIIMEHAHSETGIDIHPGASIGESFFIDHGTGVVIGETCVIGNGVRIYQGVTLGAKSFPLDDEGNPVKGIPRHPVVEDDVVIYSGATILGRVTIGRGSEIGGNVWLTRSIPPGSRITQAQVREDKFRDGGGI